MSAWVPFCKVIVIGMIVNTWTRKEERWGGGVREKRGEKWTEGVSEGRRRCLLVEIERRYEWRRKGMGKGKVGSPWEIMVSSRSEGNENSSDDRVIRETWQGNILTFTRKGELTTKENEPFWCWDRSFNGIEASLGFLWVNGKREKELWMELTRETIWMTEEKQGIKGHLKRRE